MRRTFWLASYPKSGNTWFRMLVANLDRDTPVDINAVPGQGGIASARGRFDTLMLFPSGLLTHDESDRMRPQVYAAAAAAPPDEEEGGQIGGVRFIKTHDAWTVASSAAGGEEPLLGGRAAAEGAILMIRDPRDIVASLANHNHQTIDQAIAFMARGDAALCGRTDRQHNQLRQQLRSWSDFHRSWLSQTTLPVHVLRYEDLQADTAATFARGLAFAGIFATSDAIARAVRFADFAALQAQESDRGFREAPTNMALGRFFRRGIAGGWRDELTQAQAARIEQDHADIMAAFGYERARSAA